MPVDSAKSNALKAGASTSTLKKKETRFLRLLVLPAILIIGGMYLYPMLLTVVFAFSRVDITTLGIAEFVGFRNFANLLSNSEFQATIWRSVYFAVMIVFWTLIVSFSIAMILNRKFVGRNFLRTLILLPWAIPPVVSGVLWGQMFHAEAGTVNALLFQLGITQGNTIWLADPRIALHIVIVAEVWRFLPFATLFILAGMQNIPKSLYDAISMDGANAWQKFRKVTLPLVMPVVMPVMVVQFTMAMRAFDTIFVLTRGARGTTILNFHVYQQAFTFFNLGLASAAAYILLFVILICLGAFFLLQKLILRGGIRR